MENNELTYEVQDASTFVAVHTHALLPDDLLAHYAQETPWFVKQAVELLFFGGRKMCDLDFREAADAFIINALIALQKGMKDAMGEEDFGGMVAAYIMKPSYENIFLQMAESGFIGTYKKGAYPPAQPQGWSEEGFFQAQPAPSPWEQRGINLN